MVERSPTNRLTTRTHGGIDSSVTKIKNVHATSKNPSRIDRMKVISDIIDRSNRRDQAITIKDYEIARINLGMLCYDKNLLAQKKQANPNIEVPTDGYSGLTNSEKEHFTLLLQSTTNHSNFQGGLFILRSLGAVLQPTIRTQCVENLIKSALFCLRFETAAIIFDAAADNNEKPQNSYLAKMITVSLDNAKFDEPTLKSTRDRVIAVWSENPLVKGLIPERWII